MSAAPPGGNLQALDLVKSGAACEREGRNTSALAAYDQALALEPGLAVAAMRKALLLEELDRPEPALAAYARLLEIHPAYVAAWSNRAGLFARLGRYDDALGDLDRALVLDPNNHLLAMNKGLLLFQAFDQPAAALPWLERARAAAMPEAEAALAACRIRLAEL